MGHQLSHLESDHIDYDPAAYEYFQKFSSSRIQAFINQVKLPLSLELPSSSSNQRAAVEIGWKLYFQLLTAIEETIKIDQETSSRHHWHPATHMYAMERNLNEEVAYRPRPIESSNDANVLPDSYTDDDEDLSEEEESGDSGGQRDSNRPRRYSQEEYFKFSSENESSESYEAYR